MIRLKAGVKLTDLQPQTVLALVAAERIYDKHGVEALVVTSCNDGTHKKGSFHYRGLAADLRVHNVPTLRRKAIVEELRAALGEEFDVLWEYVGTDNEHLHVEWDPPSS